MVIRKSDVTILLSIHSGIVNKIWKISKIKQDKDVELTAYI